MLGGAEGFRGTTDGTIEVLGGASGDALGEEEKWYTG